VNAKRTTTTLPPLLWGTSGAIRCVRHAPFLGSSTWIVERWKRVSDAQLASLAAQIGRAPSCECCDAARARAGGAR